MPIEPVRTHGQKAGEVDCSSDYDGLVRYFTTTAGVDSFVQQYVLTAARRCDKGLNAKMLHGAVSDRLKIIVTETQRSMIMPHLDRWYAAATGRVL